MPISPICNGFEMGGPEPALLLAFGIKMGPYEALFRKYYLTEPTIFLFGDTDMLPFTR